MLSFRHAVRLSSQSAAYASPASVRGFSTSAALLKARQKFYAVRKGRDTGVFSSWDEARLHVDGYSGAEYMSFGQRQAAEAWLGGAEHWGERSTPKQLVAYIDGGFRNGMASIGVHWGGEPEARDLSERVPGSKQTSAVAELWALLRTLQKDPDPSRPLRIYLDSEYVLNTYTVWQPVRQRSGKTLANSDIIVRIDRLLAKRPGPVELAKSEAHTKDYGNEQADQLATAALIS